MKHIIVGTGPAGVMAADTLRSLSQQDDILLLGDEPEPPYSRMAIPYFLNEQIAAEGTHLRKSSGYFEDRRIDVQQKRVQRIDPAMQTVEMDDGRTERFDRLLIATGSQAMRPPIPGMDLPLVHNCWTLADARQILANTKPGGRAVLMGAGFIGCIILEALVSRGVELTVVEMEERMVPRMMNPQSAEQLKKWCEAKGVTVKTGAKVSSIEAIGGKSKKSFFSLFRSQTDETPEAVKVVLDSGEALTADVVVCATGVRPNTQILDGSNIEIDQGILINEQLETSQSGIFAAGDVAQGRDFSTGEYSVQAIQPTAVEHGRIAANNMLGGNAIIHRGSINMNVLDTMGLISASFGLWQGADGGDSAELSDPERFRYINLQFKDDVIVGANTLGVTDHIGVLRGLIQTGTPLGKWKQRLMNDPSQIMEAWVGCRQNG